MSCAPRYPIACPDMSGAAAACSCAHSGLGQMPWPAFSQLLGMFTYLRLHNIESPPLLAVLPA